MSAVDLHAHTTVSDGTLTPAQLVERAQAAGLVALAVTDHDHMGGLEEATAAAKKHGIEVVPGIELSVHAEAGEIHMLGYFLDADEPRLSARLAQLRKARSRRADAIVRRLRTLGIDITEADVHAETGDPDGRESIGRPHVARALMAKGVVASIQEAFDRFLGDGRPAAVPKERLSAAEALALIHGAGGVAVLAHAVTVPEPVRESLIRALALQGLDGLEIVHSKHDAPLRETLSQLARELNLVETGGSDFHGDNKPDVALGTGREGNVNVPVSTLDALKTRRATRHGR